MSTRRRSAPVSGGAGLRDGEMAHGGAGPSGPSSDFILSDVADPGLAAAGLARIGWAQPAMPVLGLIRDRFERPQPFARPPAPPCPPVAPAPPGPGNPG